MEGEGVSVTSKTMEYEVLRCYDGTFRLVKPICDKDGYLRVILYPQGFECEILSKELMR